MVARFGGDEFFCFQADIAGQAEAAAFAARVLAALGMPMRLDGHVIGAVGVSGVKADQDAQVAKAGAATIA